MPPNNASRFRNGRHFPEWPAFSRMAGIFSEMPPDLRHFLEMPPDLRHLMGGISQEWPAFLKCLKEMPQENGSHFWGNGSRFLEA